MVVGSALRIVALALLELVEMTFKNERQVYILAMATGLPKDLNI